MTEFPIHVHLEDGREWLVESLEPLVASVKIGGTWLQSREIVWPTISELLTDACSSDVAFTCDRCGVCHVYRSWVTGYGSNSAGEKICYECCGELDRELMREKGKITLYLVSEFSRWFVTNLPNTLRFRVKKFHIGKHNIARTRHDVWFTDHEGNRWWGVSYGEDSQLCHCKRLKGEK